MPKIAPCLWFDTEGEEAARFYTSVFPNSRITEVQHYPEAGPGVAAGTVSTVSFTLDGQDYVALNGGPAFTFTEAVSLQVHCGSQEEVDDYWAKLSDGGELSDLAPTILDLLGFEVPQEMTGRPLVASRTSA